MARNQFKYSQTFARTKAAKLQTTCLRMNIVLGQMHHAVKKRIALDNNLRQALAGIRNNIVQSAVQAWRETIQMRAQYRDKAEQFVQIIVNRSLSAAFRGWRSNATEKTVNRQKMMRVVKLMSNRCLSKALWGWATVVSRNAELRKIMHRVARIMLNVRVSSAFKGWLAALQEGSKSGQNAAICSGNVKSILECCIAWLEKQRFQ